MTTNELLTFGERLVKARLLKGLSQKELSNLLKIKQSYVNQWENDINLPRADKLISLSKVLDVSIDYLLKGDSENEVIDIDIANREDFLNGKSLAYLSDSKNEDMRKFLNLLIGTKEGQKVFRYMANVYYSYNGVVERKYIEDALTGAVFVKLLPLIEADASSEAIIYQALSIKFNNVFEIWTKREDKKE